jgi:hypothetical protein
MRRCGGSGGAEVLEEAGIEARVRDASLPFRHSLGGSLGWTEHECVHDFSSLDPIGGEPFCDGDEIRDVGFFSLDEMSAMEAVQGLSRWAIEKALAPTRRTGWCRTARAIRWPRGRLADFRTAALAMERGGPS